MRVFVTGASGFVGMAVTRELKKAGHAVLGLARSEASAARLEAAGVEVQRGDLNDVSSLTRAARACAGVIHTAFIHDFSKHAEAAQVDRRAVEAIVDTLAGTQKPFVVTSGIGIAATPGSLLRETEAVPPTSRSPRAPTEELVVGAAARGVRTVVLRLPPTVHGDGDHGFVPAMIDFARKTGAAAWVGEGTHRWSAVHRDDAARLYVLAVEQAAPGSRLHAVAEEGLEMRAIVQVIAEHTGLPIKRLRPDEAAAHFGWFAHFASMDGPASSAITRRTLGWEPREVDLLSDMRACYFR